MPKLSILSAMTRSTWGFNTNDLRRTYIPKALARFLCYVSICFEISGGQGKEGKEDRTLAPIRRIQAHAEKIISGLLRTRAGAALDNEPFCDQSIFNWIYSSTTPFYELLQAPLTSISPNAARHHHDRISRLPPKPR